MARKKGKNKQKVILFFPVFIIVAYFIYSFVSSGISVKDKQKELDKINEQIENQKLINEEISKTIENSDSDEYIEERARNDLGYAYPNEKIYIPR